MEASRKQRCRSEFVVRKMVLVKREASWEKVRSKEVGSEGWGAKNEKIRFSSLFTYGSLAFGCGGAGAPNRLFGEGCLSGASSRAIFILGRGGGTQRAARGRTWFWALLPKQKCLVAPGRNPASNNSPRDPFLKPSFVNEKTTWIPD